MSMNIFVKFKSMIKNYFKVFIILVFLFISEQSYALRCGNRLVDVGDPKPKVIYLCGEPAFKEMREVRYPSYCNDGDYRYDNHRYDSHYDRRRYGQYNYNYRRYNYNNNVICQYRTVDAWIYNFGPRKFMIELIFRRGVVKEVNTLEYGY